MTAAWLVGNDVVDLRVAENGSVGDRPRFLARVCDSEEQARVRAAAAPVAALWALFAAKEAAYKVVTKLRPGAILAHRRFRVAAGHDAVDADGERLALWIDLDLAAGYVHAVASTDPVRPLAALEALAADSATVADGASGPGARAVAIHLIADRLALGSGELAIERPVCASAWDRAGPPALVRGGRPLSIDVSLSHDGRFVAAAVALAAAP